MLFSSSSSFVSFNSTRLARLSLNLFCVCVCVCVWLNNSVMMRRNIRNGLNEFGIWMHVNEMFLCHLDHFIVSFDLYECVYTLAIVPIFSQMCSFVHFPTQEMIIIHSLRNDHGRPNAEVRKLHFSILNTHNYLFLAPIHRWHTQHWYTRIRVLTIYLERHQHNNNLPILQ